jgi:serine/threonine protein kinase
MGEGGLATPMQQLIMPSQDTSVTASGSATPRRGPIYLQHERIGKGSFGRVYRVTDVSTGIDYAGKYIDHSDCRREVAVMREVDHVRTSGGML